MDDKYPRGAPTGVYTGFSDGGATTHTHDMPDAVNHVHSVVAQTDVDLPGAGVHSHSKDRHSGGGGIAECTYSGQFSTLIEFWFGHSSHQHSVTFPAHNTLGAGSNPATSDAETSLIPYVNLVFCEKD